MPSTSRAVQDDMTAIEKRETEIAYKLLAFDSYVALHALVDLLNPLEGVEYEIDRKDVAAILSVLLQAVDKDLRMAMGV